MSTMLWSDLPLDVSCAIVRVMLFSVLSYMSVVAFHEFIIRPKRTAEEIADMERTVNTVVVAIQKIVEHCAEVFPQRTRIIRADETPLATSPIAETDEGNEEAEAPVHPHHVTPPPTIDEEDPVHPHPHPVKTRRVPIEEEGSEASDDDVESVNSNGSRIE